MLEYRFTDCSELPLGLGMCDVLDHASMQNDGVVLAQGLSLWAISVKLSLG